MKFMLKDQIFGGRGASSSGGNGNGAKPSATVISGSSPNYGEPGVYVSYRAGDIFDSPLGYITFGMEKSQSYLYADQRNKQINAYELDIKNPLFVKGDDFNEIHDSLCVKYAGQSYRTARTLEDRREVMKRASNAISKKGYDAIVMEATDILSGEKKREIGVLNKSKKDVIRKRKGSAE